MSDAVPTVGGALALDREETKRLIDAAAHAEEGSGGLGREALNGALAGVWSEVAARVAEALDVPIPEVLAGGWSRAHELLRYRDPERYPREVVSTVPLATHTVVSSHQPRVELEVRGITPAPLTLRLEFQVDLEATVEGAALAIRAGRIEKLVAGTIGVAARLSVRGVAIAQRTGEFTLPGAFAFAEGIPIAPAIPLGTAIPIAGGETAKQHAE
ncbi:MAG TPA: hypothetical protein VFQ39_05540 [Longimicrobium sp.]|nr:hypothetical protein [Longimicrobium sp.]